MCDVGLWLQIMEPHESPTDIAEYTLGKHAPAIRGASYDRHNINSNADNCVVDEATTMVIKAADCYVTAAALRDVVHMKVMPHTC